MKECFKCGIEKPLVEFYKHSAMADGHTNKCIPCTREYMVTHYHKDVEKHHHYDRQRQRFNIKRILSHKYSGMKARTSGRAGRKYGCEGKPLLSKEEFISWCEETKDTFTMLYEDWVSHNFDRKYQPSIDRINSDDGYTKDNIQWLRLSENSSKG